MQDYRRDFKDHCLTCKNYDIYSKGDSTHRGFRCKHYQRCMAFDESCRGNYEFDGARGNQIIEEAVDFRVRKGYDPKPDSSYWYVTSTVCKIMGFGENHPYMRAFEKFEKEYMRENPRGVDFATVYDKAGIFISYLLLNDYASGKVDFIKSLISTNMIPELDKFTLCVNKEEYDDALDIYYNLMNRICVMYGFDMVSLEMTYPDLQSIANSRMRLLQTIDKNQ